MSLKVYNDLLMKSGCLILDEYDSFPTNPKSGTMCFKGGVLYIYAEIEEISTWYPLTNKSQRYVHTQGVVASTWTITHNLHTQNLIYLIEDENGDQILPMGRTYLSDDVIEIYFSDDVKGRAILFGAAETFAPAVKAATILAQNITVDNDLIVGGVNIVDIINENKTKLDNMFDYDSGNNVITFKGDLVPETNETLSIGSSTNKIKDLFVSANTIHLGDNTKFEGTTVTVDAGDNPDSPDDAPTIVASTIIAKPFSYNAGAGDIWVRPVIQFQDKVGNNYPLSFDSDNAKFSFDANGNHGQGTVVAKNVEASGKVTADAIEVTGSTDMRVANGFRVDGNCTLGYDANSTISIRGTLDLDTPVTFGEGATLGDGNDNVSINCGAANSVTITASNLTVNASGLQAPSLTSSGDLTVGGDLFVNGTQTVVNTATLEVSDNEVVLNKDEMGAGVTAGSAGLRIERGSLTDAVVYFDESTDKWMMGIDGNAKQVAFTDINFDSSYLSKTSNTAPNADNQYLLGNALNRFKEVYSASFVGDLTGNASTAGKLSTPRAITLSGDVSGTASFDGSQAITITTEVADNSHEHGTLYYNKTETDGRYLRRDTHSLPTADISYDLGDSSHRFRNIYGSNLKGTADAALTLSNSRTITLNGEVTGSVAFDGSQDVNITCTLATENYYTKTQSDARYLGISSTAANSSTLGGLSLNTGAVANTIAARDNVGDIYANKFQGIATSAQYADLAEKYTCAVDLPIGTVVCMATSGDYEIEECVTSECMTVGVVSENPAYLMNDASDGLPIALVGKVDVRVVGPVRKGDILVPAGSGCARRARNSSEYIYKIGYSTVESLEENERLIMSIVK